MVAATVDELDWLGRPGVDSAAALFERGYPHLRVLVDGHPDDEPKKVAKATAKLFDAVDPVYHVWWPRQVAARFMRGFAEEPKRASRRTRADQAAVPWSVEEAERAVATLLSTGAQRQVYRYDVADFLYLVEAFVGPDAVVRGAVAGLQGSLAETLSSRVTDYQASHAVLPLGALLLRATAPVVEAAKESLDALLDAHPEQVTNWPLAQVAMLLHGREGVKRAQATWTPQEAYLFSGDPAYVREGVAGHRGERDIDAYTVWIGGDEVLDLYTKDLPKVRRADADNVAEALGMFASPRVVPLMLGLFHKKSAVAGRWLEAHAARVRGELERLREDKKLGALASDVLARAPSGDSNASYSEADIEKAFDALMDQVVAAITLVRGKVGEEEQAWKDATSRYMEIRSGMMDQTATESMVHFFMADGVGLHASRATAWDRLSPSETESARWQGWLDAPG